MVISLPYRNSSDEENAAEKLNDCRMVSLVNYYSRSDRERRWTWKNCE